MRTPKVRGSRQARCGVLPNRDHRLSVSTPGCASSRGDQGTRYSGDDWLSLGWTLGKVARYVNAVRGRHAARLHIRAPLRGIPDLHPVARWGQS